MTEEARGYVNAHTHLYSGLVPLGMPDPTPPPENFLQILEHVWWRLDRALDPDALRASARYYLMEARRAGTSCLIDHHESPGMIHGSLDILADACAEFGMPAVLCYGATERNGGIEEAERGLEECRRFIQSNSRPGIRGVVGLHASFTVSDDTIVAAGKLCRELSSVLHVHVAEGRADLDDARRRGYEDPVHRLLELNALPPGSILAHGIYLRPDRVQEAADRGCWFVQNPRSNAGNRVGYPRSLSATSRVALGTDGHPSDMPAEADFLRERAQEQRDTASAARLEMGWKLAESLLGEIEPAPVDVDEDDVRRQATLQAGLLWNRLGSIID